MKPTLYVSLDGPILTDPVKNVDPYLGASISDYAKPFLTWASDQFNVRLVTDRSPREAFYLLDKLALKPGALPVRGFEVSKTECIKPDENFFWVDSDLIPQEVNWLSEHRKVNRFVPVDPQKGVTPEHKLMLDQLLRKNR
jgi:hypothetical protein